MRFLADECCDASVVHALRDDGHDVTYVAEFKWTTGPLGSAIETVCAMLNGRGGEVVVRFQPLRYVAPARVEHDLNLLQQEIMQVLGSRGPLAISEIEDALSEDVPRRTLQDTLTVLRELDLLEMRGHTRGARWMIRRT